MAIKEQLIQLLSSLVEIPSITGTEAEVILPDFVVEQLSDLQYFKENPHHLQKSDWGRTIFCYSTSKEKRSYKNTVILVSHFDVVMYKIMECGKKMHSILKVNVYVLFS